MYEDIQQFDLILYELYAEVPYVWIFCACMIEGLFQDG